MTLPERDFYRIKEICAALNISRATLWRRIEAGMLPALERFNARIAGYGRETLDSVRKQEGETN